MKRRAQRETSAGGVVFRRSEAGEPRFLLIFDQYGNWGFPKGHVEGSEHPGEAARREVREETGLDHLVERGPLGTIRWFFQLRGQLIHKTCHFFLFESPEGDPAPQTEEGITACGWRSGEDALRALTHQNARDILAQAIERVRAATPGPGGRS